MKRWSSGSPHMTVARSKALMARKF